MARFALGRQTQQALRWFQSAQCLRTTRELDKATLDALGVR
jgi:Putative peptidoglycan binding domain